MSNMYAIMTKSGEYRCQQGPESWTQLDCTGWALVDEDHRYLRNKMQDGDMIVRVVRAYALAGSEHETPRNGSELAPAGTMAKLKEAQQRLLDFEIGAETTVNPYTGAELER